MHKAKEQSGDIFYIDATKIEVCNIKRANNHKVFSEYANKGKTGQGWFYGFKLHLLINEHKQAVSFTITAGNKADNSVIKELTQRGIQGYIIGDSGYLLKKEDREELENKGISVLARKRKNMKKNEISTPELQEQISRRVFVEQCFNEYKCGSNLQDTRLRHVYSLLSNIISTILYKSFLKLII